MNGYIFSKSRGTLDNPAAVQSGDTLGSVMFSGLSAVNNGQWGAAIRAYVDGTVSAGQMPGRLEFALNPGLSTIPLVIKSNGNVGIGTTNPQNTLQVDGGGNGITIQSTTSQPPTPPAGHWTIYIYDDGNARQFNIKGPTGHINTIATLTP